MSTMPRDLAVKQPAEVVEHQPKDDGRTIDGHWRAKRHGPTAGTVLAAALFLILLFLFTGYLLSVWHQS